jgi:hypothetical protein
MARTYSDAASSIVLEGGYTVLIRNRLQANEQTNLAKWALWPIIWDCSSLEELARRASNPINTSKTGRCITWRTEVRWALKQGAIRNVAPSLESGTEG